MVLPGQASMIARQVGGRRQVIEAIQLAARSPSLRHGRPSRWWARPQRLHRCALILAFAIICSFETGTRVDIPRTLTAQEDGPGRPKARFQGHGATPRPPRGSFGMNLCGIMPRTWVKMTRS
jgi:hypothetical protein